MFASVKLEPALTGPRMATQFHQPENRLLHAIFRGNIPWAVVPEKALKSKPGHFVAALRIDGPGDAGPLFVIHHVIAALQGVLGCGLEQLTSATTSCQVIPVMSTLSFIAASISNTVLILIKDALSMPDYRK